MLPSLAVLLLCQLAGEALVHALSLPVPGPVVGMLLLFGLLLGRAPLPAELSATADGFLKHLSLLFVPAGVGVVQHLDRLGQQGVRLVAVIVLATVIALAVTALTFEWLARLLGAEQDAPDGEAGP
jgi:putative effector of murein hydrolase LrgA (UPF0299 family)